MVLILDTVGLSLLVLTRIYSQLVFTTRGSHGWHVRYSTFTGLACFSSWYGEEHTSHHIILTSSWIFLLPTANLSMMASTNLSTQCSTRVLTMRLIWFACLVQSQDFPLALLGMHWVPLVAYPSHFIFTPSQTPWPGI